MTSGAPPMSMATMVRRGTKPNRNVEESLHHSPVTGMIDAILLGEMRHLRNSGGRDADGARRTAQQTAMQMSWQLHALIANKFPPL